MMSHYGFIIITTKSKMMILFVFTFIYQPTNGQIDMMSLFPKDHLFSDFLQSKENSFLKLKTYQ